MINLVQRAHEFLDRVAIKNDTESYTYQKLLNASQSIAVTLLSDQTDLQEARVAFLVKPGFDYTSIQWGIWRAGGIAVPLCEKHPYTSIRYVIDDTQATTVIFSQDFFDLLSPLFSEFNIRALAIEHVKKNVIGLLPEVSAQRRAMILYTSGTTGKPKGVVSTHFNIEAQIKTLVTSWKWDKDDHILNVLPLHHVHGIVNILCCALWSGACCEFIEKFDPEKIFEVFCRGEVNLFMAVPTIYYKLIASWNKKDSILRNQISQELIKFRLMVSGSAALPISTLTRWKDISGHVLLERYGMTEMGMAISNPYDGDRRPGFIGQPLPGVRVRILDENNQIVGEGTSGEIQIKGPNVFKEYWNKPEATEEAFIDGWFKTGDIAVWEQGSIRILGRNSVDIIKSGGYKISALEIEEVLRKHPAIKDCGVVGVPDEEWGEIVAASVILDDGLIDLPKLDDWLSDKLPNYKIPRKYLVQKDLPRNVMGKVTKKALQKIFMER